MKTRQELFEECQSLYGVGSLAAMAFEGTLDTQDTIVDALNVG